MKYLKIQNIGEMDIRLVALMGGTSKGMDESKIGQFGTGLKYTLAYLLRNNIDFHIMIGDEKVEIKTEKEVIRDVDFDIICINGHRTSITTQMGTDWQMWMIIRELWSNAIDEGENQKEVTETILGHPGYTTFYIQINADLQDILSNWQNYFIHGVDAISDNNRYSVYPNGEHLRLYKQGILIHEDKSVKSIFAYDIKDAELNELRQYRGHVGYNIAQAITSLNDKGCEYFLDQITGKEDYYESKIDYKYWSVKFSESFKNKIGNLKIIHQEVFDNLKGKGTKFDALSVLILPKMLYDGLCSTFETMSALRAGNKLAEFFEIHNSDLELKIKSALAMLEECHYFIHPELKFIFGTFGDTKIMAQINFDQKEIWVSEKMIDKPLFNVCAMIIEENEHFRTGLQDESRGFQQHFIDLYTKTLLNMHEIKV